MEIVDIGPYKGIELEKLKEFNPGYYEYYLKCKEGTESFPPYYR